MKSILALTAVSFFLLINSAYAGGQEGKKKAAFDLKNLNTSVSPKLIFTNMQSVGGLKTILSPTSIQAGEALKLYMKKTLPC
jgi:hypothetical protein